MEARTRFGLGTVMLPKPIYTMGLLSRRACSIHSNRLDGGVQSTSALSRNQLEKLRTKICKALNLLSGNNNVFPPIEWFRYNSLIGSLINSNTKVWTRPTCEKSYMCTNFDCALCPISVSPRFNTCFLHLFTCSDIARHKTLLQQTLSVE